MLTIPLGMKLGALCAVAATVAVVTTGSSGPAGFGVVRDGEAVVPAARPAAVPEQLASLHGTLHIEPAQEPAWNRFADSMLELDRVSRAFEARSEANVDAAGERARHAFEFAVALSEMNEALTPRQSVALQEGARALGGAFLCRQISRGGNS